MKPRKSGRFFRGEGEGASINNKIMGVAIGKVLPVAKEFALASLSDIERLLESPYYEVRMGAISIMDFQARENSTTPAHRKELFDLYLRRLVRDSADRTRFLYLLEVSLEACST